MFARTICLATLIFAAACGGDPIYVYLPGSNPGGGDGGAMNGRPDAGGNPTLRFDNAGDIIAFLEGKDMVMEPGDIPTHPNGLDEDVNFGQATQCYNQVLMHYQAGRIQVASKLGTLRNAPNPQDRGECDHAAIASELSFESTAVLIENVRDNGACFDITITYPGFGQEGRGSMAADGSRLVLELFFKDQATGHRCNNGEVGVPSVQLSGAAFAGDAQQSYQVRTP
jgi:hypothetical protein